MELANFNDDSGLCWMVAITSKSHELQRVELPNGVHAG